MKATNNKNIKHINILINKILLHIIYIYIYIYIYIIQINIFLNSELR